MSSKVKPSSWAISRYVVNRIPSLLEPRCDWCTSDSHCFNIVLAWRNVSWYASFTKKKGGICWHPKLARFRFSGQSGQTGQTSHINGSDRSRQVCQIANWTAPLCRSHRDDRNAYIERLIWSPDEDVMPPWRPAPRSDRSDRSRAVRSAQRPVRPVRNTQSELEVVFWHGIW